MSGDEAILRMLAGANFGPDASLILPSGRELKGDEAQALTSFYADEKRTEVAPPWRFDVPEVPPRVTAVEDGMGWTWVRDGAAWVLWGRPASYRIYDRDLIGRLPLVECPDPRAAS